jgi:phosphatidylglycerophosphate synthase
MESSTGRIALTDAATAMVGFLVAGSWLVAVPLRDFAVPYLALAAGIAVVGSAGASILRRKPRLTTPADRVTLVRAVLAACCATMAVPALLGGSPPGPSFVVLGGLAFVLDAVDGAVARRTGSSSPAGARLDGQADAALVLVLSCAAARSLGPWVLASGLMWYVFVAAGQVRPAGCAQAEQAAEDYRRLSAVCLPAGAHTRCAGRTRHRNCGLGSADAGGILRAGRH